jgi:hypothetical protein
MDPFSPLMLVKLMTLDEKPSLSLFLDPLSSTSKHATAIEKVFVE